VSDDGFLVDLMMFLNATDDFFSLSDDGFLSLSDDVFLNVSESEISEVDSLVLMKQNACLSSDV
jgi:hypothetical protein